MSAPLREIGYWRGDEQPERAVDLTWSSTRDYALVLAYLKAGMLESYEHGYSWCRFKCAAAGGGAAHKLMGCASLTDGTWVWPEGYSHYLEHHAVKPPAEFIKHVLERTGGDIAAIVNKNSFMFDPACPSTHQSLPAATRAWLAAHSTLCVS